MAYPFTKGHIVSGQPRKGVLGAHFNTFMLVVSDLGYAKVDIEGLRSIVRIWPEKGGAI